MHIVVKEVSLCTKSGSASDCCRTTLLISALRKMALRLRCEAIIACLINTSKSSPLMNSADFWVRHNPQMIKDVESNLRKACIFESPCLVGSNTRPRKLESRLSARRLIGDEMFFAGSNRFAASAFNISCLREPSTCSRASGDRSWGLQPPKDLIIWTYLSMVRRGIGKSDKARIRRENGARNGAEILRENGRGMGKSG